MTILQVDLQATFTSSSTPGSTCRSTGDSTSDSTSYSTSNSTSKSTWQGTRTWGQLHLSLHHSFKLQWQNWDKAYIIQSRDWESWIHTPFDKAVRDICWNRHEQTCIWNCDWHFENQTWATFIQAYDKIFNWTCSQFYTQIYIWIYTQIY